MKLTLSYRGSLSSCDYACHYCPFAKTHDDATAREQDKQSLVRFLAWVESRQNKDTLRILFTPWGEALIRKWYRDAIIRLSHMNHVSKVTIQTNLSSPIDWLAQSNTGSVSLWITYHPGETPQDTFIKKLFALDYMGVKFSVGMVGKKEYLKDAQWLKRNLPEHTYLWVNAYKDELNYYSTTDIERFQEIDPLFQLNLKNYSSYRQPCNAGETNAHIDSSGNIYPCHFLKKSLGNIYLDEIHELLKPGNCSLQVCDCYIGYVHLKKFNAASVYGEEILSRIPLELE